MKVRPVPMQRPPSDGVYLNLQRCRKVGPMIPPLPHDIAGLSNWIIQTATVDDSGEALLKGMCDVLRENDVPVWHVSIAAPTIDPQFRGVTVNWRNGEPIALETASHGAQSEEQFRLTPIFAMQSENLSFKRWNVSEREGCDKHLVLEQLRRDGCTDYVMFLLEFSPSTSVAGTAIAIATDRSTGFSKNDLERFESIIPALGLAIYRHLLFRTASQTLDSYLGSQTGARVLAGQIVRGQGETMRAAILLADLAAFTTMVDREDSNDVVRWLNEHLEALGEPVLENGGEIRKFLGDGLIAIFPSQDTDPFDDACEAALRAAHQCIDRNDLVNRRRLSIGSPTLVADIVLHFGEIVYGNVGTSRRLDFTAIGRAVNEASRIEKLCEDLDRRILLSEEFASRCKGNFIRLGSFILRGVDKPKTLFGIKEP